MFPKYFVRNLAIVMFFFMLYAAGTVGLGLYYSLYLVTLAIADAYIMLELDKLKL